MSDSNLIPVGKYKGQPIEVLAEDKQYTDWLVAQPWFRERYGSLYAVIINNFCEPSDTPDHNALQARFLDDDFRLRFASVAIPRLWWYARADGDMAKRSVTAIIVAESRENPHWFRDTGSMKKLYRQEHWTLQFNTQGNSPLAKTSQPKFEIEGVDCRFSVTAGIGAHYEHKEYRSSGSACLSQRCSQDDFCYSKLLIEIKPQVGDDYPSILRQMRRNGSQYLFTKAYIGDGVDQPTFIQFMDSQGIRVIFEHEVDQSELIRVDTFDQERFLSAVRDAIELDQI